MVQNVVSRPNFVVKFALVGGACLLLLAVYIFQRTDIIGWLVPESRELSPALVFSVNRYMRIVLNDVACFCIIYAFFGSRHLALAFWVFLIEILVILPVYLVIKLTLEGDSEISSPLLSQVHRLIVNPVLMFLLILGFLYQKISEKATGRKS